jgi:hypothetical protein
LHQGRSTLNQDITQNQHPRNLALKVHVYFENVHEVYLKVGDKQKLQYTRPIFP